MKIIIDNNIVLDALLGRHPYNEAAERILLACAEAHEGYLSANSLTDIFYVLRKLTNAQSAKAAIKKLMELLHIISVNAEDCINALELPIDDFEDALVMICAKNVAAEYIVTRDADFLSADSTASDIQVISPVKLIQIL